MPTYKIVLKHTHYTMHKVEAASPEKAVTHLRENADEGVNVDEYFGDWQELAEGEVISVTEEVGIDA